MIKTTLSSEKVSYFLSQYNRLEILYNWIQKNEINLDDFEYLLNEHYKEVKRQMDFDSFD